MHLGPPRSATWLTALALLGSVLASRSALAHAPWQVSLGAGTTGYDRRAIPLGKADLGIRTLTPGFLYDPGPGPWSVHLAAQRRFMFLDKDALFDSVAATPDRRRADHAALRVRRTFNPRDFLALDGRYVKSPDLLDTERGVVLPGGDHTRWDAGGSGSLRRVEGAYAVSEREDPQPTTAPATITQWHLSGAPLSGAREDLFAAFRREQLDLDRRLVVRSEQAVGGYRRRFGPGVALEVEAGANRNQLPDYSRPVRPTVAVRMVNPHVAPSGLSFEVAIQGDSLARAGAKVSHVLGFGRAFLLAESVPDIEGAVFRAPTLDRRAAFGVEDTLGRANVVGVEASYERVRELFVEHPPSTTIFRSSVWLIRRIQPWLDGRIGWSYLHQPRSGDVAVPPIRRVRMDAELTFVGP